MKNTHAVRMPVTCPPPAYPLPLQRRLTEQARKIRDGESKDDTPGDAALRREWEQLAAMLGQGQLIDHEDVKWVTLVSA